jgi:hypothetical protein
MNFNGAMLSVRHGGRVVRGSWYAGTAANLYLTLVDGIVTWMLPGGLPTIAFGQYTPNQEDIMATDWVILNP